jgi:hypothetical protein
MRLARMALAMGLLLILTGCDVTRLARDAVRVMPSGNMITETRTVDAFQRIEVRSYGSVEITQGTPQSLTVTGSDNIVSHVTTSAQQGMLVIDTDSPLRLVGDTDKGQITFRITVPDLTALTISGAADIRAEELSTSDLALTVSGVGRLSIGRLSVENLEVSLPGMGDIELAGQARQARIAMAGAGNVQAPDLEIATAEVTLSGLGNAEVWVTGRLSGRITGVGSVSYYGEPTLDTTGTGLGVWKALGAKASEM